MTEPSSQKKILYIDMDNTLVDFKHGISLLSLDDAEAYKDR